MNEAPKTHENRLRRLASRQELMLRKSRTCNPDAVDHGRYYLVDVYMNAVVFGCETGRPTATLAQVESYLAHRF